MNGVWGGAPTVLLQKFTTGGRNVPPVVSLRYLSSERGRDMGVHVFWDWNGTLCDDVLLSLEAVNQMLRKRSRPPIGLDEYYRYIDVPTRSSPRRIGAPCRKRTGRRRSATRTDCAGRTFGSSGTNCTIGKRRRRAGRPACCSRRDTRAKKPSAPPDPASARPSPPSRRGSWGAGKSEICGKTIDKPKKICYTNTDFA